MAGAGAGGNRGGDDAIDRDPAAIHGAAAAAVLSPAISARADSTSARCDCAARGCFDGGGFSDASWLTSDDTVVSHVVAAAATAGGTSGACAIWSTVPSSSRCTVLFWIGDGCTAPALDEFADGAARADGAAGGGAAAALRWDTLRVLCAVPLPAVPVALRKRTAVTRRPSAATAVANGADVLRTS